MSVTVRPLVAEDRPRWEPLWQGYLDFYGVKLVDGVTEATWKNLLDPDRDVHALCALDPEGKVIGIAHFLFHPVTWSTTDRCYLEDLYVAEDARGLGAGRALLQAVYEAADERRSDQVYWLTEETNHTARRLYDRVARRTGFIKYQR